MKNSATCANCGNENPFYQVVCSKCNYFIREKVINLDLWKTLGLLIENPLVAFRNIIFSEHKNFIILIVLLSSIKLLIDSRFLAVISVGEFSSSIGLIVSYCIVFIAWSVFLILYTLLISYSLKFSNIKNRLKDNLAIIIYSQFPLVLGVIVLFPLEIIIFGDYIFSANPSPFVIKEFPAFILFIMECLLIVWSILLMVLALFTQSQNIYYSLFFSFLYYAFLSVLIYTASLYIFTI